MRNRQEWQSIWTVLRGTEGSGGQSLGIVPLTRERDYRPM